VIWAILAFAFAALGSKVLLGLAVVYGILPGPETCAACDGETTPVEVPRGVRALFAWLRVQYRWCPGCGESFLARAAQPPRLWVGAPKAGEPTPDLPQIAVRRPQ
jgi:hypothetical protein